MTWRAIEWLNPRIEELKMWKEKLEMNEWIAFSFEKENSSLDTNVKHMLHITGWTIES